MANTRLVIASAGGQSISTSTVKRFYSLGSGALSSTNTSTEPASQVVYRTAGTLSNLYIRTTAKGAGTGTLTIDDNAVASAITLTIAASTPGVNEDTTHTKAVVAGDPMGISYVNSSNNATTATVVAATFAATGTTCTRCVVANAIKAVAVVASFFNPVSGVLLTTANNTEANTKIRMRKAGTFTNGCANVFSNLWSTGSQVVNGRLNGANGVITIAITNSTTGFFEDTTHSDSVAVGDDYCTNGVFGDTSHTGTLQNIDLDFTNANSDGLQCCADGGLATVLSSVTTNYPISGDLSTTTTEANAKCLAKDTFTCSNITINLTTNTVSATSTLDFRKSGANGNQTASITASVTGIFSDTTHNDVLAVTDDMNYQLITGAAGTSMIISFMCMNASFPPPAIPLYLQPVTSQWIES